MATVNELVLLLACRKCGSVNERTVQFRYGWLGVLTYHIGSRIEWREPSIGEPHDESAFVEGWLSICPNCQDEGTVAVIVLSGVIAGITTWGEDGEKYLRSPKIYRYID